MANDYLERMELLKKKFVEEAMVKLESLKKSIGAKETVINQGIDSLFHMQFDNERGLIVDQINTSMMESSAMDTSNPSSISIDQKVAMSDEVRKMRARNRREIESLEHQAAAGEAGKQSRMCGCDAYCSIF